MPRRTDVARPVVLPALMVLAVAACAFAQPSPADEARIDAAKGDYRGALRKLEKTLFASSELPPPERYELLMLKGECQVQLQDRLGAVSAFKAAGKIAEQNAGLVGRTLSSSCDWSGRPTIRKCFPG